MASPPRVSVVIDNYNYGRYLRQAIESVLAQDYAGGVECVVSDDGSTDESREVIGSFGGRVKAVLGPNRGQATAFNAGFAAATGEIVCLLDSDDYWTKDKVASIAPLFADPEVGLVEHYLQDVDAAGAPLPRSFPPWPEEYALEDFLERRVHFTATSGLAFRKSILDRILPIPKEVFNYLDTLLCVKALCLAKTRNLPKVLGFHRVHGANYWAGDLRNPKTLELDLRMRALFKADIEPWLAKRGARLSPRWETLESLEVSRRRILLHMLKGERGAAAREWAALVRDHGASRMGLFRAATCLTALASPWLYLRLYELYGSSTLLPSARGRLLPG